MPGTRKIALAGPRMGHPPAGRFCSREWNHQQPGFYGRRDLVVPKEIDSVQRYPIWLATMVLLLAASLLLTTDRCGGGGLNSTSRSFTSQKIQHVVVIFQENRTPDNLFHSLPNADIANSGVNSRGQIISLTPVPLANNYDLSHVHAAFVKMYDSGKMDGADKIPVYCAPNATGCPPPNPQFAYVDPSDVAPYFQLAERYSFGDRMFQTNQGPSFPAHQFIISGTSAPTTTSDLFAAENPILPRGITEPWALAAPLPQTKPWH
jgi:phospholipase C